MKGFTLIEILLSITIVVLLAGLSLPVYQSFQVKNDLDVSLSTLAQTLRRAQILSQTVYDDKSWGVYVQNDGITIFSGETYAARDTSNDEIYEFPGSISVGEDQELIFDRVTGLPQLASDISLTSSNNETRLVEINEKGIVSY